MILHLALFSGLRPGEILAVRRRHIAPDRSSVTIEQRVYRGVLDDPKNSQSRTVAVPPRTAALLKEWLDTAVDTDPDAWAFASENRETPLWRDNLLRRHVRPALRKVGLGWVDFKVMRRTNASLRQDAKVDPKVSADQRGHGIGVSLDVYTKTSIQRKAEGAQQLGGRRFGPQGGADPREGGVMMDRLLNVVQKSVCFLGFSRRLLSLF